MKKLFFILVCAAAFGSCEKKSYLTVPDPRSEKEPETIASPLTTYTTSFKMYDMLFKTDGNTKNTFMETGRAEVISGQTSYTGYYQCFNAEGSQKWAEWIPITRLPAEQYCNKTVFDITTDGSIIDCFNVKDVNTGIQMPYIQKLTADGEFPWDPENHNGKPFYTFSFELNGDIPPCEGFVAADHKGGAWVAAGNSTDSVVVARVDRDGNIGKMVKFDSEGTLGERTYLSHPQMMVGDNDELYLLLQYADFEGNMYNGYYDLVKISPDGDILSERTLMKERTFSRGIYGNIRPDGKGGAYVIFKAPEDNALHLLLEHFNIDGEIDFPEKDLNPQGPAGSSITVRAAVEPSSGKCVVVYMDDSSVRSYMYSQVIDTEGHLLTSEAPEPHLLLSTEANDFLDHSYGFELFYNPGDGKMHLYYVLEENHRATMLKRCTISTDGKSGDERNIAEIDVMMLGDGYEDSSNTFIDGKLRFWWLKTSSKNFYSFTDRL